MTSTTTRWNSPAILTCSSRQRAARCCRWGQREMKRASAGQKKPHTYPPLTSSPNPPSPAWPGKGQVSSCLSWDRAASDAGGCFQPASHCGLNCHWSAVATPPASSFHHGLALLWTAGGMCCVLFLCVGLIGCHGGSCVPQEQSWERRQACPSISPAEKGNAP